MKHPYHPLRRLALTAAMAMAGLFLWVGLADALTVSEAWRVGYTGPGAVSIDPADGSCWFTSAGRIVHLGANGSVVSAWPGAFHTVSVNPGDSSCWATDLTTGQLTHFAADGTQLYQGGSYQFPPYNWLQFLDVDPADNSIWFGEWNPIGPNSDRIVHCSESGAMLWASTDFMTSPRAVSVNPNDGSCWMVGTFWFMLHEVSHFAVDGTRVWTDWAYRPMSISVDTGDNSVWYPSALSPALTGYVYHRAEDASLLLTAEFGDPFGLAANPRDGSCWVLDRNELAYITADGTEVWRGPYGSGYWYGGASIAVDPRNGSCRIADGGHSYVARLNVIDVPQAAIVASPMAGSAPLTVSFHNWSLGTPTSCLWDFGDGTTSTEDSPTHTYAAPGHYSVTLTVGNECGTDCITCRIDCIVPQCATRTPGFWFTHPDALLAALHAIGGNNTNGLTTDNFDGGLVILCTDDGGCTVTPEDAMAIFWDAHGLRATFAQHILAALFNDALLRPAPPGIIDDALAVFCDPDSTNGEISAAKAPLVAYNESGTALSILWYQFGNAAPRTAREMASYGEVPECVEGDD